MFAGKVGDVYSASNAREIRKRKKQQKQHPICLTENLHSKTVDYIKGNDIF